MENFRKTIKTRIILLSLAALLSAALGIFDVFFASTEMKISHVFAFQSGAAAGMGVLSIALIIRFKKILSDESKLKIMYNQENDERLKSIRAKAGMPMVLINSLLMIAAGVVAGYFNSTVFFTLILAAGFQLMAGVGVKFYYMKTM